MVGSLFLQMVLYGTQYRLQMAQTEALGIWYQNEEHDGEVHPISKGQQD